MTPFENMSAIEVDVEREAVTLDRLRRQRVTAVHPVRGREQEVVDVRRRFAVCVYDEYWKSVRRYWPSRLKSIFAVCGSVPLTEIVAVTLVLPLTVLPLPGLTQTFSV